MNFAKAVRALLALALLCAITAPVLAQGQTIRIVGTVRDEANAITLPGVPVEVVGTPISTVTDVDGRYVLPVPPGSHQVRVALEGYQEKVVNVATGTDRTITA